MNTILNGTKDLFFITPFPDFVIHHTCGTHHYPNIHAYFMMNFMTTNFVITNGLTMKVQGFMHSLHATLKKKA
jgi:hypothetical protein